MSVRVPLLGAFIVSAVALSGVPVQAKTTCAVTTVASAEPDLALGRKAFLKCRACHTLKDGEKNLVGPNLWQFMKRPALGASDFKYSPAFQKEKPVWDARGLEAFLEKPSKAVPGTRMIFAGMADPKERGSLIAWLATETGTPLSGC